MSSFAAPRSLRFQIGIFGRRNVGKSSLLNALTRQDVSLVSDVAGTTTDPVQKPMELQPLGPVSFIDTAGIDDEGDLGRLRVKRSHRVTEQVDMALLVVAGAWGEHERLLLGELKGRQTPVVVVFNQQDRITVDTEVIDEVESLGLSYCRVSATSGWGLLELREAIIDAAPTDRAASAGILVGLVQPGQTLVLVVPIDKEAPKGRLILPQVQTLRDALDSHALCMVVRERELRAALMQLKQPPGLVITDSQAFLRVAGDVPPEVPLTSFSILFARHRGDLATQIQGTLALDRLRPGDKILVAEACTHHPIGEDIGRVKIPRWITQYVGGRLQFTTLQGRDFPDDLSDFQLVVHCGACMLTRREMANRLDRCRAAKVPVTNYGLVIARSLGIFERALEPFPEAWSVFDHGTPNPEPS